MISNQAKFFLILMILFVSCEAPTSGVSEADSNTFEKNNYPSALRYLLNAENVLLSPHVGGWTHESHLKLATTIIDKIKTNFLKL